MAQIAETAERYEDMSQFVSKAFAKRREQARHLTINERERGLFSVAYKTVISAKRNSLRLLLSINAKPSAGERINISDEMSKLRLTIEKELRSVCMEAISICDQVLENPELLSDHVVYYLKMKGDYYRYLAEFASEEEREEITEKAEQAYQEAVDQATVANVGVASPIFLGLILNFSVFYYEIMGNTKKAIELASKAYDDAFNMMKGSEELCTEAYHVLPLLKDNLALWKSEEARQESNSKEETEPKVDSPQCSVCFRWKLYSFLRCVCYVVCD